MECPGAGVSQGECFYCQKLSSEVCECGVFYCSKECLKIHRPGKYCLPFKVCTVESKDDRVRLR